MGKTSQLSLAVTTKQNISDNGYLTGYRNKIINGDFGIWQRGTTSGTWVAPVSNFYLADRWLTTSSGTGGNGSITLQTFALGQTDVPGNPTNFLRWQITSAASGQSTGSSYLEQRIEDVRTLSNSKATVTLYLKGTGTLPSINLVQNFGTGGSPSSQVVTNIATSISLNAGWTKYQYVVNVPSISGKTLGSTINNYLALNIQTPINTIYTLDIAHVSIVEGDATLETDPFSPRLS